MNNWVQVRRRYPIALRSRYPIALRPRYPIALRPRCPIGLTVDNLDLRCPVYVLSDLSPYAADTLALTYHPTPPIPSLGPTTLRLPLWYLPLRPAYHQEIRRWCPCLKVVAFHGPATERERIKKESLILGKFDVMCTTYEMLVADIYTCQRFHWSYIVLDEAHRIKNEKTLMGQAVRRLRSSHRLLITGI
eukprot:1229376-Rhodomonas_salina.2